MLMNAKIFRMYPLTVAAVCFDVLYATFTLAEHSRIYENLSPEIVYLGTPIVDTALVLIFSTGVGVSMDWLINFRRQRQQRIAKADHVKVVQNITPPFNGTATSYGAPLEPRLENLGHMDSSQYASGHMPPRKISELRSIL